MAEVNLMIAVDDEHMGDISSIAQKLRREGLHVSQQLDEVGVITGTIDEDAIGSLDRISGISAIERQRVVYTAEAAESKPRKLQNVA
jgi:hypothetical protein